jgi:acylglycerol lipase
MACGYPSIFSKLMNKNVLVFLCAVLLSVINIAPVSSAPKVIVAAPLAVPDVYWWGQNDQPAKGIVIGLHGFALHGRGFEDLALTLGNSGYRFAAMDLRGHGSVSFERVDYDKCVDDLCDLLKKVHNESPDLPIFLLGESIGGAVILRAVPKSTVPISGIILSSPGIKLRLSPKLILENTVSVLTNPRKRLNISPYLESYAFNDQTHQNAIKHDSFARRRFGLAELIKTGNFLTKTGVFMAKARVDAPMLVVQGGKDRIAQASSISYLEKYSRPSQLTIRFFPTDGHIMLGYTQPPAHVVDALKTWLDDHGTNATVLTDSGIIAKSRRLPKEMQSSLNEIVQESGPLVSESMGMMIH